MLKFMNNKHESDRKTRHHSSKRKVMLTGANGSESLRLSGQKCLDVGAAREDAVEVDPAALHVDPNVEHCLHAPELLVPRLRFLFELLLAHIRYQVE